MTRALARQLAASIEPIAWTAELRQRADAAPVVLADLEVVGPTPVRVLARREHRVEILGESGHVRAGCAFELALVIVDGEHAPRWIAAERLGRPA